MSHEVTTFIRAFIWLPPDIKDDYAEESYVYFLRDSIEFLKLKEIILKKYPEAKFTVSLQETTPYQTALKFMGFNE